MQQKHVQKEQKQLSQLELKFLPNELKSLDTYYAINQLIYGSFAYKYSASGKSNHKTHIYVLESDPNYLQWLSKQKKYSQTRLEFSSITNIKGIPNFKIGSKKQDNFISIETSAFPSGIVFEFTNSEKRNIFWYGVSYFISNQDKLNDIFQDQMMTISDFIFTKGDQDGNNQLDIKETDDLLCQLNVEINKNEIKKMFDKFDKNHNGSIERGEFLELMKEIMRKPELELIYKKYTRITNPNDPIAQIDKQYMSLEEFRQFLKIEQNEPNKSDIEIKQLLKKYGEKSQDPTGVSLYVFTNSIFNMDNQIFNLNKAIVYQSMDHPLTHYYINSSHNTYLLENQLTGKSSVQAYINAFQKGCKCVEIDCWDGPDDEPIVYHGHTLTSKILFQDVIKTVKEYGFANSPYPVILSIENHCSIAQQDKMAGYMKTILNKQLHFLSDYQNYLKNGFKSPSELLNKIIVKSSGNLNEAYSIQCLSQSGQILQSISVEEEENEEEKEKDPTQIINSSNKIEQYQNQISQQSLNTEEKIEQKQDQFKHLAKKCKESKELLSTLGLFGCKMNFNDKRAYQNISSINENKIKQLLEKQSLQLVIFHIKYFSRIYPAGLRVDSSNYDPIPGFLSGSQIVALNQQSCDKNMMIYMGKFQENGGRKSGYLLKPEWMINPDKVKSPNDFTTPQKLLTIEIISAQQLQVTEIGFKKKNKDIVDPYVQISVVGIEKDTSKICKTDVVKNNGFNPVFKNNVVQFPIHCPDQALVQFEILDEDVGKDDLLGWYSLSFSCMRTGYRVIPLWDANFQIIPYSYILAKITVSDFIKQQQ